MKTRILLILMFFMMAFASEAQVKFTPYITTGYIHHMTNTGVNTELGLDLELHKKIGFYTAYRFTNTLKDDTGDTAHINGFAIFLAYNMVNNERNKFSIGPGYTFGRYKRTYGDRISDTDETGGWMDWLKLRYQYKFQNNFRLGVDASLYGDGEASEYVGVVLGYQL